MDRSVNDRDATLYVIATEGEKTEPAYFRGFQSFRVRVKVIPTGPDGRSSPWDVLERLREFKNEYELDPDDELWIVLDLDRWEARNLRSVCREAHKLGALMAVSNPCFELWLYLHLTECDFECAEFEALVKQKKGNLCAALESAIRRLLQGKDGYQKSRLRFEQFEPGISDAIRRARDLDTVPAEAWPRKFPGTHVYRLVSRLHKIRPPYAG